MFILNTYGKYQELGSYSFGLDRFFLKLDQVYQPKCKVSIRLSYLNDIYKSDAYQSAMLTCHSHSQLY